MWHTKMHQSVVYLNGFVVCHNIKSLLVFGGFYVEITDDQLHLQDKGDMPPP